MPELTPQTPQTLPSRGDRVRIFISSDMAFDIDKMNKITSAVLGKLGCPACHSGRVLDFVSLQDFVVHPQTLEVQEVIGSRGL